MMGTRIAVSDEARAAWHKWHRLAQSWDCAHDVDGGDMVRPWCGSPPCPLCRRNPAVWRELAEVRKLLARRRAAERPPADPPLFGGEP